jgi:putative transposase
LMYTYVEEREDTSLRGACNCLGVSRRGYRLWHQRQNISGNISRQDILLRDEIQRIACEFPRYGYRRVTYELCRRDFNVNHKRVYRLMREDNLLCLKKRFKPQTTDSNHNFRVYPNLAKDLEVSGVNQLWVADITYIQLTRDFVYLAALIDAYSRKCLGWQLSRNINTGLTLDALEMAIVERDGTDLSGLIHHSDQGVQYASKDYIKKLRDNDIRISMSRKGNPYDNAFAESFIKTLKYEEVYLKEYNSFKEAYSDIREFIEDVYNEKRIHSSIGYKTPNEYEKEVITQNIKLLT